MMIAAKVLRVVVLVSALQNFSLNLDGNAFLGEPDDCSRLCNYKFRIFGFFSYVFLLAL